MPRSHRQDEPGAWFHVMNRGLARRTTFPDRSSIRMFLNYLARASRTGRIEVHSYCVLATHYHLLVRSPRGELSEALRRIQNLYVRWFNRRLRRDGPLFRGRFLAKRIESIEYRRAVVRYIDANPVAARLVSRAEDYPFSSTHRLLNGHPPPWLKEDWIRSERERHRNFNFPGPASSSYFRAFPRIEDTSDLEWVERRLHARGADSDPWSDLVTRTPESVQAWMQRKASLADGTQLVLAAVSQTDLEALLQREHQAAPSWSIPECADDRLWFAARVALHRDLAGLSWSEMSQRLNRSRAALIRAYENHKRLVLGSPIYAQRISLFASELLTP